jgi:hypothetical protein
MIALFSLAIIDEQISHGIKPMRNLLVRNPVKFELLNSGQVLQSTLPMSGDLERLERSVAMERLEPLEPLFSSDGRNEA